MSEKYKGYKITYRPGMCGVVIAYAWHNGRVVYEATAVMAEDALRKLRNVIDGDEE
jgi:hypothetical protein